MISGNRSTCMHRCATRSCFRRFPRRIPARAPSVRPRTSAAKVSAPSSHTEESPAFSAAASAGALLQWACSGWPEPEYEHDSRRHRSTSPASTSASSSDSLFTSKSLHPNVGDPANGKENGPSAVFPLRVAARDLGPGRGRGLIAISDVAPGEILLSVPLTRVFTSQPDSELHWSAEMAVRLLRAKHLSAQQHQKQHGEALQYSDDEGIQGPKVSNDLTGPEVAGEAGWGPWIAALPSAVRTPLEYEEAEVRQLGCPYVMEEVQVMQQCVRDCYEVLRPELEGMGCGWQDFLWAVQIFHSRCFFEPSSGLHMCVPGVDLANHSPQPNAAVRLQHSPGACQGYDALAEVAEPPPPEPSRFDLVAGEAGIRCGEEVTISYGRWPSEAFLLLFGFVPTTGTSTAAIGGGDDSTGLVAGAKSYINGSNCFNANTNAGGSAGAGASIRADVATGAGAISPGDSLTVFRDAEEAVHWCLAATMASRRPRVGQQGPGACEEEDVEKITEAIVRAVVEAAPEDSFVNLTLTLDGVDGRLQGVLELVSRHLDVGPRDLLRSRLQERLGDFTGVQGVYRDDAIKLFVQSKCALARLVLAQL
ncbi:hypothetical protein VaNZ11_015310 [Volvox africanus]|uniref:SET domain-containing protein n=1 Tax=Volvox africanus TaxID=51714 RepID=A0ABQ5SKN0_9CHLO|nr:hypothetical protein VaNZ11_015310 [Volvox africanus]